jgi:hypothetical protein
MKRPITASILAGSLLILAGSGANAAPKPKLSFFKEGASIGWSSTGGSSPLDTTNDESIEIVTELDTAAGAYTWGNAEEANSIVGRTLGQVDRMSFDASGYLGAGAPRISLITSGDDGDHTYFLSAFHCNEDLGSGWVEADFVNDASCSIFRDSEPVAYEGWDAVAAAADANGEVVTDWFLIVDEGPATSYVDRLVVQDWGWVRSGTPGIISCLDVSPPC